MSDDNTTYIAYYTLEPKRLTNSNNGDAVSLNTSTDKKELKPTNGKQLVDVLNHRIFANDINENLKTKLPFIFIEEYSLLTSSLINQFRYFQDIGNPSNMKDIVDTYQRGLTNTVGNSGLFGLVAGALNGLTDLVQKAADTIAAPAAEGIIAGVNNTLNLNARTSTFNSTLIGPSLKPYEGLYNVASTGFSYFMPYFEDKHYDITNKFTDNFTGFLGTETEAMKYAPNIFKAGTELIRKVSESFLSFSPGAVNSPSTYVEVPQYFTAGDYEEITVKFDLLNTYSPQDLQKNYDLLFLLAYQNLPYREDIARISPPKLYSLFVPGQMYLPYCYMKSMKVDYLGNRRNLPLLKYSSTNNGVEHTKQNVIVPDCYRVTITFISMVKPAANFMIVPEIASVEAQPESTTINSGERINFTPPPTPPQPRESTTPATPATPTTTTTTPAANRPGFIPGFPSR